MRGVFVTGTDTGVGKTLVAGALLRVLVGAGLRAVGMKPVSAGFAAGAPVNADVTALALAGNVDAPLEDRNPFAFADPVAPHIAAERDGSTIDLATIEAAALRLAARADAVVVEGAGGALVPLGGRHDMLDIAARLDLPVLLVVGMRLGCQNHALLTALAIRRRGLAFGGWVANALPPPMAEFDANIDALAARLGAPLATAGAGRAARFAPGALAALRLA